MVFVPLNDIVIVQEEIAYALFLIALFIHDGITRELDFDLEQELLFLSKKYVAFALALIWNKLASFGCVLMSRSREPMFVTGTTPGQGLFFTRIQKDFDPSAPTPRILTLVDLVTHSRSLAFPDAFVWTERFELHDRLLSRT